MLVTSSVAQSASIERDFGALALERRDVDLPHRRRATSAKALHRRRRGDDLAGLGLARHAVRGVHRGAEHVAVLEHHRPEMAADADRHRLAIYLELGMLGDLLLHLRGGIQGVVRGGEGRHDLIAHGLDDGAVIFFGGAAHDFDADGDHVARAQVAHQLVQTGRADDVGEQYGELGVFAHAVHATA